tara:strand:+ start:22 stop:1707 length:1686 start_codon:yes stop_codon:yes gene_type:complete
MSAFDSTIEPQILPAIPDFSRSLVVQDNDSQGTDLAPTKMSPMDSLKAIFEDIRDGIDELVVLTKQMASPSQDRNDLISDADVKDVPETDSQGNSEGGGYPEVPEVGPKLGLALMLGALAVLFQYSDEIAKAIEPVLKAGAKVVEALGVKGTLFAGLGLIAGIKFGPAVYKLLTKGIPDGFAALKAGFGKMKTFVMETAPNAIKGAYGGAKGLVMKAFKTLKAAFTAMKVFLLESVIPAIASAYGGVKGKLMGALSKLGKAFTAMRLFLMGTMIPTIAGFMAPFIVPLAILVAVVAGAVAVFTSIKAGIDEFKKSLDEGDSMLTAIIEGVSTALLTLVTLPITLIKNFVAWVAEKLGFEGIAEKLKEFSIVDFIKDGIKNLVTKAKDFVLGLFDIDFKGLLGKGLDILGAIMTRIKAIAAAGFAAVKAAFPGGESPAEAFSRVYQERIATSEASEPDVDETMAPIEQKQGDVDYASIMPEEKSKAELQREGTAKILAQDPTLSKSEARKMYIAEDKASNINNVIQTTNSPTTNNSSSNTTQTGDLAVDGSDNTAKYLAAMA